MADFKQESAPVRQNEREDFRANDAHEQHLPSEAHRQDPCTFMEEMHMREKIGDSGADVMCGMYRDWGANMTPRRASWRPTVNQQRWFDSLGSSRHRGRRSRRQTDARGRAARKEYRALTERERERLHRALNVLKRSMVDDMSMYDVIVMNHAAYRAPAAHFGPAFLPFHREYLFR